MPTKKLKGQPCAYCPDGLSTREGDHVLAREFAPIVRRDRLPKVPACEPCNNKKSSLERYLVTVLPFGARHADATEVLTGVERRLAGDQRLARELREGLTPAVDLADDGRPTMTLAVPLDGERLLALTSLMARGLLYHHWKQRLGPSDVVRTMAVNEEGDALFRERLLSLTGQRVDISLANGVITYSALRAFEPATLSIWRFHFFGGAVAIDEHGTRLLAYWAFTGRERVIEPLLGL